MSETSQKRMAALAIGISDADPLPFLRGAINGAHQFHHWAQTLGYEAELLTDEKDPVTVDVLRAKLEAMLKSGPEPIHRLALYFAGHGLIREAEEGLWLLSDWDSRQYAIAVEVLKRRLRRYGIAQIAIFADACRTLPPDINAADLSLEGVLGKGPANSTTEPEIDKFIATQDGATSFAVPGKTSADDRCLFSGVLMEGLWGTQPAAFSKFFPGKVTSQSLKGYLKAEVPKRAASYKRKLEPSVHTDFQLGADVYFGDLSPAPPTPEFVPWPDPDTVLNMGAAAAPSMASAPDDGLLDAAAGLLGGVAGFMPVTGLTSMPGGSFTGLLGGLFGLVTKKRPSHESPPPAAPPPPAAAPAPPEPDAGQELLLRIREQEIPDHFETGAGFAVDGGWIKQIWTPPGYFAGVSTRESWWHVGGTPSKWLYRPIPVLIELESGLYLAPAAMPHFVASAVCDTRGANAMVYREIYGKRSTGDLAAMAIAKMESGSLRADAVLDEAVALRQNKHADPVLGVISAYLYDSIGDVDSIRRMAWYYVQHDQGIPYDIALLGQLSVRRDEDGLLIADVPAVSEREPRTEEERKFTWTYTATSARSGVIAGFWPWMRQGWAFLEDADDTEGHLIAPFLAEARPHLTTARFTTFDRTGGREMVDRLGDMVFGE